MHVYTYIPNIRIHKHSNLGRRQSASPIRNSNGPEGREEKESAAQKEGAAQKEAIDGAVDSANARDVLWPSLSSRNILSDDEQGDDGSSRDAGETASGARWSHNGDARDAARTSSTGGADMNIYVAGGPEARPSSTLSSEEEAEVQNLQDFQQLRLAVGAVVGSMEDGGAVVGMADGGYDAASWRRAYETAHRLQYQERALAAAAADSAAKSKRRRDRRSDAKAPGPAAGDLGAPASADYDWGADPLNYDGQQGAARAGNEQEQEQEQEQELELELGDSREDHAAGGMSVQSASTQNSHKAWQGSSTFFRSSLFTIEDRSIGSHYGSSVDSMAASRPDASRRRPGAAVSSSGPLRLSSDTHSTTFSSGGALSIRTSSEEGGETEASSVGTPAGELVWSRNMPDAKDISVKIKVPKGWARKDKSAPGPAGGGSGGADDDDDYRRTNDDDYHYDDNSNISGSLTPHNDSPNRDHWEGSDGSQEGDEQAGFLRTQDPGIDGADEVWGADGRRVGDNERWGADGRRILHDGR